MTSKPGPVPKRSTERRRRNADSRPETVVVEGPAVKVPSLRRGIHPLARQFYRSLQNSAQSRYYEPSDWVVAQIVCEAIDAFALERRTSLMTTILNGATQLLATEADRRRLRLEIERTTGTETPDKAPVSRMAEYRRRAQL